MREKRGGSYGAFPVPCSVVCAAGVRYGKTANM